MSDPHQRCQKLDVPLPACLLRFGTAATTRGEHLGDTIRNEMVIAHYDASGHIVELELVGDDKPCQAASLAPDVTLDAD